MCECFTYMDRCIPHVYLVPGEARGAHHVSETGFTESYIIWVLEIKTMPSAAATSALNH